jgi:hypothetical protein
MRRNNNEEDGKEQHECRGKLKRNERKQTITVMRVIRRQKVRGWTGG